MSFISFSPTYRADPKLKKQHEARLDRFNKVAEPAVKATNAYGNMREMLDALGIHANSAADYNTKFGIALNKRAPVSIDPAPQLLFADSGWQNASNPQLAVEQLQADFALDTEGLDMVFFALPDAAPEPVYQTASVVAVAPSSSEPAPTTPVRKMTYGVCKLFYAHTEDWQGAADSSVNTLGAKYFMVDFLSKDLQKVLKTAHSPGGPEWDWYDQWEPSLTTTVLRAPQHGKFVNVQNVPNDQYLADRGYIGKDRIDVLVEGKDDLGRPISLTVRYYINVLSDTEKAKLRDDKLGDQVYRKYCGTSNIYWRISNDDPASDLFIGQAGNPPDLTGLYAQAAYGLQFADLPSGALGQTTGTTITLDDNAAGHGWFVDTTPWSNEEWLPTHNPNEWVAKSGSVAR